MPNQATTAAELVEAVKNAVVYTFTSGTYGIRVEQVDLTVRLLLEQTAGGELEWRVVTVGGHRADGLTQTLQLTWTHAEDRGLAAPRTTVEASLIRGLDAADIGVRSWSSPGLPLAFRAGQLTFELAVSESGQLSVAGANAGTERHETHTVTLRFGPA